MRYVVTSNLPGRNQITTVVIDGAAEPETAIRRAQRRAQWPDDAVITAEAEQWTTTEIAAAATGNYYGSSGLSNPDR